MLRKALLISVLFHLSLVLSIKGCGKGNGNSLNKSPDIIPITHTNYDASPLNQYAKMPTQKKKKEKNCKNFYGGVGIAYEPIGDNIIVGDAPAGYPAYEAGIRPGDKLITNDGAENLRGEVGTTVTFGWQKFGSTEVQQITLTREKICIKP